MTPFITDDHTRAEYMLMGTFLSLAITLAVGLTATWLLGLIQIQFKEN